jgi:hypothetical protein
MHSAVIMNIHGQDSSVPVPGLDQDQALRLLCVRLALGAGRDLRLAERVYVFVKGRVRPPPCAAVLAALNVAGLD